LTKIPSHKASKEEAFLGLQRQSKNYHKESTGNETNSATKYHHLFTNPVRRSEHSTQEPNPFPPNICLFFRYFNMYSTKHINEIFGECIISLESFLKHDLGKAFCYYSMGS